MSGVGKETRKVGTCDICIAEWQVIDSELRSYEKLSTETQKKIDAYDGGRLAVSVNPL